MQINTTRIITADPPERLKFGRLTIPNAGEELEQP